MAGDNGARRPVRRSAQSRRAILDAALGLLREEGYSATTIERIAARAGVGKQTIYRWWPSKGAVVFEAFLDAFETDLSFPDTGDLAADLTAQVSALARLYGDTPTGRHMAELIGGAQTDPDLGRALLAQWLLPRREVVKEFLRRAQQRGQLRDDVELDVVVDLIFGGIYYRLVSRYAPLDAEYAAALVRIALTGLAARELVGP